jgi:hypothetical protein
MFGTTMMLTVGTALDRAQGEGRTVRVAVAGEWITGKVVATDGQGVVLAEESGEVTVVRADSVTAVRILPEAGSHIPTQPTGARPHPGPEAEQA